MSSEPFCTIVGYFLDHEDAYCTACAQQRRVNDGIHDKRWFPLFDKSEYDEQPLCAGDDCGTLINVNSV